MNLGIALPILENINVEDQLKIAIKAEELGFKSVWASDHVIIPKEWEGRFADIFPDPFIILTAISENTSTIRIGTSAAILPYRNPIIVAKMLSTLDHLSNGRLICTVAIGWMEEEFRILNVPFEERTPRTLEYIELIKTLWNSHPSTFKGKFYSFEDVSFYPKPKQKKLPIWMGGTSDEVIKRSVEFTDGWQPIWFTPQELKQKINFLEEHADSKGLSIDNFDISIRNRILITDKKEDNPNNFIIGQKEEVFNHILAYKDLGISEVVLDFLSPEFDETIKTMEILSKELLPNL
ncbi:MAG: TIGR03619 family F420-dependent LLM class oxidoreductase [Thermodesulfobacteriota bacterium]|nr:TIGR03619 family F420-dependent LLM class oxidoreductase [Thermodesulfobacteriota bacterium]|tara:strand:+ start:534 stop:1412 length:879 start_codon:yes stop_codon:yes gene_type:complete